jgi:hypothetical protein
LIRHAHLEHSLAAALAIRALPVAVIESPLGTLLVSAIGAPPLPYSGLLATDQAAIPLPAITMGAEKEHPAAFAAEANPQPQNHFAVHRHAFSLAALDNGDNFVAI